MIDVKKLHEAKRDYKYLLNRGYNRSSALNLVCSRYRLNKTEKNLLFRAVHPKDEVERVREKTVKPEGVRGKLVAVDGYNQLITVEAGLKGDVLVLCDDGFIRDVEGVYGKYKVSVLTGKSVRLLAETLKELGAREVVFLLDKRVSRSGELAAMIRGFLNELGVKGTALTVDRADVATWSLGEVVASSDSVILNRARTVFDLAGFVVTRRLGVRPIFL